MAQRRPVRGGMQLGQRADEVFAVVAGDGRSRI